MPDRDDELSPLIDEARKRGIFKRDPELAGLVQEAVKRGIIPDTSQPAPKPRPVAAPRPMPSGKPVSIPGVDIIPDAPKPTLGNERFGIGQVAPITPSLATAPVQGAPTPKQAPRQQTVTTPKPVQRPSTGLLSASSPHPRRLPVPAPKTVEEYHQQYLTGEPHNAKSEPFRKLGELLNKPESAWNGLLEGYSPVGQRALKAAARRTRQDNAARYKQSEQQVNTDFDAIHKRTYPQRNDSLATTVFKALDFANSGDTGMAPLPQFPRSATTFQQERLNRIPQAIRAGVPIQQAESSPIGIPFLQAAEEKRSLERQGGFIPTLQAGGIDMFSPNNAAQFAADLVPGGAAFTTADSILGGVESIPDILKLFKTDPGAAKAQVLLNLGLPAAHMGIGNAPAIGQGVRKATRNAIVARGMAMPPRPKLADRRPAAKIDSITSPVNPANIPASKFAGLEPGTPTQRTKAAKMNAEMDAVIAKGEKVVDAATVFNPTTPRKETAPKPPVPVETTPKPTVPVQESAPTTTPIAVTPTPTAPTAPKPGETIAVRDGLWQVDTVRQGVVRGIDPNGSRFEMPVAEWQAKADNPNAAPPKPAPVSTPEIEAMRTQRAEVATKIAAERARLKEAGRTSSMMMDGLQMKSKSLGMKLSAAVTAERTRQATPSSVAPIEPATVATTPTAEATPKPNPYEIATADDPSQNSTIPTDADTPYTRIYRNRDDVESSFNDPNLNLGYSPAEAKNTANLYESVARGYADRTGKTPEDWYKSFVPGATARAEVLAKQFEKEFPGASFDKRTAAVYDANRYAPDGSVIDKVLRNPSDLRSVLVTLQAADKSTAIHELGHIFVKTAQDAPGFDVVRDWVGAKEGETWKKEHHERFALGFERYLREGKAPNESLRGVFEQARSFLREIYQTVRSISRGTGIKADAFSPEVKSFLAENFGDISDLVSTGGKTNDRANTNRASTGDSGAVRLRTPRTDGTASTADAGAGTQGEGSTATATGTTQARVRAENGNTATAELPVTPDTGKRPTTTQPAAKPVVSSARTADTPASAKPAEVGKASSVEPWSVRRDSFVSGKSPSATNNSGKVRLPENSGYYTVKAEVKRKGGKSEYNGVDAVWHLGTSEIPVTDPVLQMRLHDAVYGDGVKDSIGENEPYQVFTRGTAGGMTGMNQGFVVYPKNKDPRVSEVAAYKSRTDAVKKARSLNDESYTREHRQSVEAAIAEGKEVPVDVLADYPDLAQSKKPENRNLIEPEPEVTTKTTDAPDMKLTDQLHNKVHSLTMGAFVKRNANRPFVITGEKIRRAESNEVGAITLERAKGMEYGLRKEGMAERADEISKQVGLIRHALQKDYESWVVTPQGQKAFAVELDSVRKSAQETPATQEPTAKPPPEPAPQKSIPETADAFFANPANKAKVKQTPENRALLERAIMEGRKREATAARDWEKYTIEKDSYNPKTGTLSLVSPREKSTQEKEVYSVNIKTGRSTDPDSATWLNGEAGKTMRGDKAILKDGINTELRKAGFPGTARVVSKHAHIARRLVKRDFGDSVGMDDGILFQSANPESFREKQVKSPEFKNWFGDSKVVDESGNPRIMYHGTNQSFTSFDGDRKNPDALYGPGFYFTVDADVASGDGGANSLDGAYKKAQWNQAGYAFQSPKYDTSAPLTKSQMAYAKRILGGNAVREDASSDIGIRQNYSKGIRAFNDGEAPFRKWLVNESPMWVREKILKGDSVKPTTAPLSYPVYLSVKNPVDIDAKVTQGVADKIFSVAAKLFPDASIASNQSLINQYVDRHSADTIDTLYDDLVSAQNHGRPLGKVNVTKILQEAGYDGITHIGGNRVGTREHRVFIAFEPSQIKSVNNRGTFDPDNPDILFQTANNAPPSKDEGLSSAKPKPEAKLPAAAPSGGNDDDSDPFAATPGATPRFNLAVNEKREFGASRLGSMSDDAKSRIAENIKGIKSPVARRIATKHFERIEKGEQIPEPVWRNVSSVIKGGMLSNPATHARNVTGNAAFQLLEEASRLPASFVDMARVAVANNTRYGRQLGTERTVDGISPGASARAFYKAATDGVSQAKEIMKTGEVENDVFDPLTELSKLGINREIATKSKVLNVYTNTIFRALNAEDRVFKVYALARSLESQAKIQAMNESADFKRRTGNGYTMQEMRDRRAEILNNVNDAMMAQGIADAETATFANDNKVSSFVSDVRKLTTETAGEGARFGMDMLLPFDKTPTNVLGRTLEYVGGIGIAPTKAAYQITKGIFTPQEQRKFATVWGRGNIGAGMIFLGYKLAEAGVMTGMNADSKEYGKREDEEQQEGSIYVDGKWHKLSSMAPMGALLAIGATLAEREVNGGGKLAGVGTAARGVASELPLLNTSETLTKLFSSEYDFNRTVANYATMPIPAISGAIASQLDNTKRVTKSDSLGQTVLNTAMNKIPGLRTMLPAKEGNPPRPEPFMPTNPIPGKVSPILELFKKKEKGGTAKPTGPKSSGASLSGRSLGGSLGGRSFGKSSFGK